MKRTRFAELDCGSNPPTVTLYDKGSEMVLERGPVSLEAGADCGQIQKSADDRGIRKLTRNGEWVRYYKGKEAPLNRGQYVAGEKEGEWEIYAENGDLVRTIMYQGGDKEGEEILYFKGSDEWQAKGPNHNGMKEGVWQEKPVAGSSCISTGSYSQDEKTGEWVICQAGEKGEDPYVGFRGKFSHGFRTGGVKFFHPDGQVMAEGKYTTNPLCLKDNGPDEPEKCEFRTGPWQINYDDGSIAMKGSYNGNDGKKTGTWVEYYRSGQLMARGERKHARNGMWNFYSKSGELIYQFKFSGNDFSPVYGILYENGKKTGEGDLASTLVKYDIKSDTLSTSTIRMQGKWILYENGQKIGEGEMMMGKKQGKWKELEGGKWVDREYMLGRLKK